MSKVLKDTDTLSCRSVVHNQPAVSLRRPEGSFRFSHFHRSLLTMSPKGNKEYGMTKPRDLSVGFNFPKWLSSCLCCHKPSTWSTRLYHSELLRHIAVIIIIVRRHSVAGRYDLSRTTSSGIEVHLRNPHYNLNTAGHHFCWFNEKTN